MAPASPLEWENSIPVFVHAVWSRKNLLPMISICSVRLRCSFAVTLFPIRPPLADRSFRSPTDVHLCRPLVYWLLTPAHRPSLVPVYPATGHRSISPVRRPLLILLSAHLLAAAFHLQLVFATLLSDGDAGRSRRRLGLVCTTSLS